MRTVRGRLSWGRLCWLVRANHSQRRLGHGLTAAVAVLVLLLCVPAASHAAGLSIDQPPTEMFCDPGDVFVPDPTGLGLLWAADDGDGIPGCGTGGPLPVCNIAVPNDSACDLDAITFDTHPQIPPPVSISLDDGDVSPFGNPQTNAVELYNVPPGVVTIQDEVTLLLGGNPTGPEPDPFDDDVDAYETNMTAGMLPHPAGYFFDFSTDQDNPCGLDSGDIYFAICPGWMLFCDDVTQIFNSPGPPEDDCDIDALHNIIPTVPFPSGNAPPVGAWGYLFSIDANSGPGCLNNLGLDPGDIYYTECSTGAFPGFTLWADDVTNLGMVGCDNPGAGTQNSTNYCDLDAISVEEVTPVIPPTPTETPTLADTPTATPTQTQTATDTPTAAAAVCGSSPAVGCTSPGKSMLIIKDKDADGAGAKDKLIWKWLKGPALTQASFGDPVGGGTAYTLCVYDSAGLVTSLTVPPGGDCSGKPCWSAIGGYPGGKGYKYKDKLKNNDGVMKVLLKGDPVGGKSKILLKGKDGNLPLPALPLDDLTAVTVQLIRNDSANCWEGVLPGPAIKNTNEMYKDKNP